MVERRTYEIKRTEIKTKRWSNWAEILWVLGVSFFFSLPSSPSFSYGNPSSSSALLGSSINQRLYEIPAGAKGQRRKLAAVFSSPFMLATGLIAKCAISLISTLKQTPRQAGEELFALLLHFMAPYFILRGGGGGVVVALRSCILSPLSLPFFFAYTYPTIFRCKRVNNGARSSQFCFVHTFQRRWRSSDYWRPFLWHRSKVVALTDERPGEHC